MSQLVTSFHECNLNIHMVASLMLVLAKVGELMPSLVLKHFREVGALGSQALLGAAWLMLGNAQ